jgi:sulfur carrier protein
VTVRVRVNGSERTLADGTTVATMLEGLGLPRDGAAVERNREIVPRSRHTETVVEDGDTFEIVTAVGGG